MGFGVICSAIVLVLLVALGIYVKQAQDKQMEQWASSLFAQLNHATREMEARLASMEQRFDGLEAVPEEPGVEE
ncbi:MAG: hypothetical protein JW900_05265 [Anaerolineae bacterium]|nr:hypothetical protein [Anaerolineae bacterium]